MWKASVLVYAVLMLVSAVLAVLGSAVVMCGCVDPLPVLTGDQSHHLSVQVKEKL